MEKYDGDRVINKDVDAIVEETVDCTDELNANSFACEKKIKLEFKSLDQPDS